MARIKGPRKVDRYSAEFKLKAGKLPPAGGKAQEKLNDAASSLTYE